MFTALLAPFLWLRQWARHYLRRSLEAVVDALPHALTASFPSSLNGSLPRRPSRQPDDRARELVLRLHLGTLRRAERHGLPRRPSETPEEYAEVLEPHLHETWSDVQELTASFHEARYTRHDVGDADVQRARKSSYRVRAALLAIDGPQV